MLSHSTKSPLSSHLLSARIDPASLKTNVITNENKLFLSPRLPCHRKQTTGHSPPGRTQTPCFPFIADLSEEKHQVVNMNINFTISYCELCQLFAYPCICASENKALRGK